MSFCFREGALPQFLKLPIKNARRRDRPAVLSLDERSKQVSGEIYAVDDETLGRLYELEREGSSCDRKLIDVTQLLANGERLPSKPFIDVGREDFAKAFDRGPPYWNLNECGAANHRD